MSKRKLGSCDKTIREAFECFQIDNVIKGLREQSVKSYQQNLRTFIKFLDDQNVNMMTDINEEHIKDFVIFSKARGIKPTSINTYLRSVKRFLYFSMDNNFLPKFKISLIKVDFEKKEPYTDSEMRKLTKKPNLREIGFVEYRTWVAICYMSDTGNRQKSVINIKVSDVDLKKRIVKVRFTKNRKGQVSFISQEMAEILEEYIARIGLSKDDFLFPNERGGQMAGNTLYNSVEKYNKQRGVKRTGTHGFRRFFATHSYGEGVDPYLIQDAMGHHSIDQTMQYISFDADCKANFSKHSFLSKQATERKVMHKRGKRRKI